MAYYYINKNTQSNGDNEVHTTGCPHPPDSVNRVRIGDFATCAGAVAQAKRNWPNNQINGCFYCAKDCHTT